MSKQLRIVFFGTPEFATGVLAHIHQSQHEIVAVVTAVDKPAGRGRKIQQSHVKQFALDNNIPVLQPSNLKSPDFLKELASYHADLQVIVAFRMLPKAVWDMPPLGTFNLHASLLPQYRGAAPINWAIINGDQQTGVTTFFIDDKIDTGAIIDQLSCDITPDETLKSLYDKLNELGKILSLKTVNDIANGKVTAMAQKETDNIKPAPKLNSDNTTINWNVSATQIDALVRGLYPFPIAKALLEQNGKVEQIKIHQTAVVRQDHDMQPGTMILKDHRLFIACKKDLIEVLLIQLPNKKAMSIKDLMNGYQWHASARMINKEEKTS